MSRSLHLVDPELRDFVEAFPKFQPSMDFVQMMRAMPEPPLETLTAEGVHVSVDHAPAQDAPPVRLLIYTPEAASTPLPVILHIHGGGYIIGSPAIAHDANAALCRDLGVSIVSVNYRLAPETPYPGPLEDCYAALAWIFAQAEARGFDTSRVAIKGESAGGGLAAGLALLARDRGAYRIAFQCLTYPMIDDRSPAEPHPFAGEFVWPEAMNRFGWHCYLGEGAGGPDIAPTAAPARATSLAGLPPTLILTGALDLFVEEDMDYARRLTRAGVPVELIVYPGVVHGFERAGETAVKARYQRDVREGLARVFEVSSEVTLRNSLMPCP